jgi:hypothetical protein
MKRESFEAVALGWVVLVFVLAATWQARSQDATTPYPNMAPLEQYLITDRNAEIAMAQSAAPESISRDAEVLVLGRQGYETAVKGKNGFVCLVQRSWMAPIDDPEFWNPKGRAPICLNAPAVRSFLPRIIRKTELVLSGRTKAQIFEEIAAAIDKKELPAPEANSMSYMMSKQSYNDRDGNWHPHLMLFLPQTDPLEWGAGLKGTQIFAFQDTEEHLTVILITVGQWSDGTAASPHER